LSLLNFQYLGIRTIANSSDVSFRPSRRVGFFGGYHYSTRRVRSSEGLRFGNTTETITYEQDNTLHAGVAGIRIQPTRGLSLQLDSEIGRADRPLLTISERNYHSLGGRIQYKTQRLLLAGATRAQYNVNSVSLFTHSARSRVYSVDASWASRSWLSFDAGYSKQHFDSLTGIAYFALGNLVQNQESLYTSNIHALNLGVRLSLARRADLMLGYNRVEDTGDGRSTPSAATRGPVIEAFRMAQVYPLTYDSPQARLSVQLRGKLRWNAGYQFYHFAEEFLSLRNYRAHTGFTSLTWAF